MFRMRITLTGAVVGGGVSTFYFDDDLTAGAVTAARAALNTFWVALTPYLHTSLTWGFDPEAEEVSIANGHIVSVLPVSTGSAPGTGTGDILPAATQGLIRWRTGAYVIGGSTRPVSREIRGRTFVPAMCEANNTAGLPSGALLTAFNTAATALVSDAATHLAVYSKSARAVAVVTLASTGTLALDTGTNAATPVGVFLGCTYTDPSFGRTFRQFYPGTEATVHVPLY